MDRRHPQKTCHGMTAVEVLVASLLSALLMVAVMGTMRGLKAHERALTLRDPTESWQRSLAHVLQQDLENARTLRIAPQFIELQGVAGLASGDTENAWLPVVIRYEIRQLEAENWLVRSERHGATARAELVCRDVAAVRVSSGQGQVNHTNALDANREQAVTDGLKVEFLRAGSTPVFQYVFRQL
jgi:hypothetical protein